MSDYMQMTLEQLQQEHAELLEFNEMLDKKYKHHAARAEKYRRKCVSREVQLVEWDIERNETDYEFYFDGAWNAQQSKIDELNCDINVQKEQLNKLDRVIDGYAIEVDELQKRLDAVKGLAQTLWEKSEEKHQQGKVWESKTLGECADEILDVLEQALKGEQP